MNCIVSCAPPLCRLAFVFATLAASAVAQDSEATVPERVAPDGYHGLADIEAHLQGLAANGQCELITVARSIYGRPVQVAAFRGESQIGRPAMLVVANPDGDRPVGGELALALTR